MSDCERCEQDTAIYDGACLSCLEQDAYALGVKKERARCLAAVDAEEEPGSWSDDCVESAKKNIRARIEANPMEAARRLRELAGSMMDGTTSEEYIARVRERTEEKANG